MACLLSQAGMAPAFELLFDVFDGLLLQSPKVCSIGYQKGDLKASLCDLRKEKCKCMLYCLYSLGNSSHFSR